MNYFGKENKINNNINSNTDINDENINKFENSQIKSKSENLFYSYDILKSILSPNLSKEKNKFMDTLIDIIKSQIKLFIKILNFKDSRKIFDILNTNNQNLSKQITEIYNSINFPSSSEISNKDILNDNIKSINDINSIFNDKDINYFSESKKNNYKIEENNKSKINIEKIKQINDSKNHENPIKINIEIKNNSNNHRNSPFGSFSDISSNTHEVKNNKKKDLNIRKFNEFKKIEQKIKSYTKLKYSNNNNKLNLTEKKNERKRCNSNLNNSPFLSKSINDLQIKKLNTYHYYSNSCYDNRSNSNHCIKNININNKYKNIESKVALYLKREDEFNNKRINFQLYKKRSSSKNKNNKNNELFSLTDNQDLYQLLPNSLKEPLDDFIKKKQNIIFDEKFPANK